MIRIEQAIARAYLRTGTKITKKQIAERLWAGSSEAAQKVNMSGLCNGSRERVSPEWVRIICEMCDCSADYLFGLSED